MLKQRWDRIFLVAALAGCHATAPGRTVATPCPERSATVTTADIHDGGALAVEAPLPTASTVGMWLQMETGTGWGSREISIFANGKIVWLTWHNGQPTARRKYVDRSVLDGIKTVLGESGIWDLPAHCCECLGKPGPRVDDGFFAIFRSFEPGKVRAVEYYQGCHDPPPNFGDLVSRIDSMIGESGWTSP